VSIDITKEEREQLEGVIRQRESVVLGLIGRIVVLSDKIAELDYSTDQDARHGFGGLRDDELYSKVRKLNRIIEEARKP
jgi:hypothetical protein